MSRQVTPAAQPCEPCGCPGCWQRGGGQHSWPPAARAGSARHVDAWVAARLQTHCALPNFEQLLPPDCAGPFCVQVLMDGIRRQERGGMVLLVSTGEENNRRWAGPPAGGAWALCGQVWER